MELLASAGDCFACHDDAAYTRANVHRPLDKDGCAACHRRPNSLTTAGPSSVRPSTSAAPDWLTASKKLVDPDSQGMLTLIYRAFPLPALWQLGLFL